MNHIEFISNPFIDIYDLSEEEKLIDFVKLFTFQIGVQAYSKVGHMATLIVNVSNNSVTPMSLWTMKADSTSLVSRKVLCHKIKRWIRVDKLIMTILYLILVLISQTIICKISQLNKIRDKNDGTSSVKSDDTEDDTSDDETDNEDTEYVERQIYTEPNQIYFGSNGMLMRPEIIRILQLGGACKRKIINKNKNNTTRKIIKGKTIDEYSNIRIDAIARAICFTEN